MAVRITIATSGSHQGARPWRGFALWFILAAIICSVFGLDYVSNHWAPPADWERASAHLQRRAVISEKTGVGMNRHPAWFVEEAYLVDWQGTSINCTWRDTIFPGFRDTAETMAKTGAGFSPTGTTMVVRIDPANRGRCRPKNGWSTFSKYQTLAVFGLAGMLALCAMALWRKATPGS